MPSDKTVLYTLSLTVARPIWPDSDSTVEQTATWMTSTKAQRELEREILKVLGRLDGDCDVEVMSVEVEDDL